MLRIHLVAIFLIVFSISYAQERASIRIDVSEGPNPWSSLDLNNSPETFQFAIVTDRTGGHRPGVFLDGIQKLNLLQPEFVMSVGDLIEGYTEDTVQLNWEWNQFQGFIDSLDVPFFYLPGNHDITNKVMEDKWKELFGKTYYHFLYKDVLFLCLNSEDNYRGSNKGTIDDEQYAYIEKVLEENPSVKWTLVFMHQPLWNQKDTKRWKDVELLLQDRKHSVFVGHNHRYMKYERNNGKYFILATTGGGSDLSGPNFGRFDHVVWVTMTDEGPIIANLLLEGIWHEDVFTEDLASFILPISYQFPVTIPPVFVQDSNFGKVDIPIKITNEKDLEAEYQIEFGGSRNMVAGNQATSGKINPNDVFEMPVHLMSFEEAELAKLDPIDMTVRLTYQLADRKDVVLDQKYVMRPAKKYDILENAKAKTIDGKLEDWNALRYEVGEHAYHNGTPFNHTGSDDASARFDLTYDDSFVYIGCRHRG